MTCYHCHGNSSEIKMKTSQKCIGILLMTLWSYGVSFISGIAVDKNGQGLEACSIELGGEVISKTSTSGEFQIKLPVSTSKNKSYHTPLAFRNRQLLLSLDSISNIEIQLVNFKGQILFKNNFGSYQPGNYKMAD